ncbi:CBS domain-containing protein [Candidatus Woesearchaeota archaeon]|nr:CBS domain-containing protein [Candidatus Woesearchaeota archaeon]
MDITSGINKQFLRLDTEMSVSEMIGSLKKASSKLGLVFRNGKYVGLVEKKRLLRVNLDPVTTKIGNYLHAAPVVNEHADVIETAYMMHQSNTDLVPIASANTIIGVLPAISLLHVAAELPETKEVRVGDLRVLENLKVKVDEPLAKALQLMFTEKVDELPVFDAKGLYGVLSVQDVLREFMVWPAKREYSAKMKKEKGGSRSAEVDTPTLANLPVSSFSTNENLQKIDLNDRFGDAVQQMEKNNISCLMVYSGKQYVGLLSVKGLLRYVASLEVPQNFNIQYVGLNAVKLASYEKESFQKVASNESFKLQRLVHNDFKLVIHLKAYDKDGTRQKYSVTMRLDYPGKLVEATAVDWDIVTALRKAFDGTKNELQKMFRKTQSRKETPRRQR